MKKFLLLFFAIIFLASLPISSRAEVSNFTHTITLKPGWNIFSATRVVENHLFSTAENNFDVYLLDSSRPSGWATMSDLGQAEFTPLYGYFINNKTLTDQTLILNYKQNVSPAERLFERELRSGWNVLGIANPSYAIRQKEDGFFDTNNIGPITSSLNNNINAVVDFSVDNDKSSVAISDVWNVSSDINSIEDFRETKAYGVNLKNAGYYYGTQNNDPIKINDRIGVEFSSGGFSTAFLNETGVSVFDFKIRSGYPASISMTNLIVRINPDYYLGNDALRNMRLVCGGQQKYLIEQPIIGDNLINATVNLPAGETICQILVDITDNASSQEDYSQGSFHITIPNVFNTNVWSISGNEFGGGSSDQVYGRTIKIVSNNIYLYSDNHNIGPQPAGKQNINMGTLRLRAQNYDNMLRLTDLVVGIQAENEEVTENGFSQLENLRANIDGVDYSLNFSTTTSDGTALYSINNINAYSYYELGISFSFDSKNTATNQSYRIKIDDANSSFHLKTEDWRDIENINIQPNSILLDPVSIESPLLNLEKNNDYDDQNIGPSAVNAKVGSFYINTSIVEGVDLNYMTVNLSPDEAVAVSNLSIKRHDTGAPFGVTKANPGTSNVFNDYLVIPAGSWLYFDLYADINSDANAGPWIANIDVSGHGSISDNFVSSTNVDLQTMTISSGAALKVELKTTDAKTKDDMYILAGTNTIAGRYLGELVFTTSDEPIRLTDLVLQEYLNSTDSDVKVVKLYDSIGNVVAYTTPSVDGHVYFQESDFVSGRNIFPANQPTSYFIGVQTKSMNADGDPEGTATFNHGIQYSFATPFALSVFDLAADKAVEAIGIYSGTNVNLIEDTGGSLDIGEYSSASVKTKTASTTGSILRTITNVMSDGVLSGGIGKTIGQYNFLFDNGSNRTSTNLEMKAQLRQLILSFATSSGTLVSNVQAYILGNQSNYTTAVQLNGLNQATIDLTTMASDINLVDGQVSLVITADLVVTGTNQYIQTSINDLGRDFTYNGNNGIGSVHWSNVRLDGIFQVIGGTLFN